MKIKLTVFRRPNMFKVNESIFNMVGVGELEKLFTLEGYRAEGKTLTLFYPERFLNIIEERALLARCEEAGYSSVDITTSSVYLIQCCHSKDIGIIQDESIPEGSQFKLSNDYSGMPDDRVLHNLHCQPAIGR